MNTCGIVAGETTGITLRHAIRLVLKLAADVDSPRGVVYTGLQGKCPNVMLHNLPTKLLD